MFIELNAEKYIYVYKNSLKQWNISKDTQDRGLYNVCPRIATLSKDV